MKTRSQSNKNKKENGPVKKIIKIKEEKKKIVSNMRVNLIWLSKETIHQAIFYANENRRMTFRSEQKLSHVPPSVLGVSAWRFSLAFQYEETICGPIVNDN